MSRRALPGRGTARGLLALAALAALAALGWGLVGQARGERTQSGNLIVSLDGSIAPLKLPRDRLAPVAVRLEGGLQTADGALLPRVRTIELGLPGQAVITTGGLPTCTLRQLRNRTSEQALISCRRALVGHGAMQADVVLPHQGPFRIHARLLAFNARVDGHRTVIVHAVAAHPPTAVVLPFRIRRGSGRFGTALVADLPGALGPYPHFSHFELTLSRRYSYRGRRYSYLSSSCPIPKRFTAGFFSFAKADFTLAGGRRVGTAIARGCRAR